MCRGFCFPHGGCVAGLDSDGPWFDADELPLPGSSAECDDGLDGPWFDASERADVDTAGCFGGSALPAVVEPAEIPLSVKGEKKRARRAWRAAAAAAAS